MNKNMYTVNKDNKYFITEVDEDMENVIFKVIDKINNDYIMIVNDANRYDDYLNAEDRYDFLRISTYQNMIDFYYNKMISECNEKIEEVIEEMSE